MVSHYLMFAVAHPISAITNAVVPDAVNVLVEKIYAASRK
jgi:hypothetical protein